jgi:hypothetical protein
MISIGLLGHLSCACVGKALKVARAAKAMMRMRWVEVFIKISVVVG